MSIEKEKLRKQFESLSTRHGGSLLFEKTKMDQSTVAVFIGLGGLGGRAVNAIKAATTEKLNNPDRRFFLAVDTCRKDMNRISSATAQDIENGEDEERIHGFIDGDEKMTLYSGAFRIGTLGHSVDSWLDRAAFNERTVDDKGAQGLRQIGRVMLLGQDDKYEERYKKLREILLKAKNKAIADSLPMRVYIISGIGGGTGSGTVVDFAYMVRKAMADFALDHQKVEGVLFTPDVQKNDNGMSSNYYDSLCVNFYAAMKEIDYFYNNKARRKAYVCPIEPQVAAYKEDIFDECTLVSSLASGVSMVANSDELVLKFANAIAFELGGIQGTATNGDRQSYDAFYSNVQTYFRYWFTRNSNGTGLDIPDFVSHRYSTLGYSSFYIPRDEIVSYCANKLVERMVEDWEKKDITAKEIKEVLSKYGLATNRQFATRLFDMANCSELFDVDDNRLPKDGLALLPVKNCANYLQDMADVASDSASIQSINNFITIAAQRVSTEIIKPILSAVDKAFTSPDGRGPVYAINLLSAHQADRKGIMIQLAEMIDTIEEDVRVWRAELQQFGNLLSQKAEESDGKTSIDPVELQNYTDDARRYGEDLLKTALLLNSYKVLRGIYDALNEQNSKAFSIYTTTFDYLKDMLRKDSEYVLNTNRHREGHTTIFTFDLADFKANDVKSARFKEYFDKVIDTKNVDEQSRIFINDIFCKLKSKLDPVDGQPVDFSEKDVIDILRSYFNNAFAEWTTETIEKFCVVAYSDVEVDPTLLTKIWEQSPQLKTVALQAAATAIEGKLESNGGVLLTSADPTRNVEGFAHYSTVYGLNSTPGINQNFENAANVICMPGSNWSEFISYKRIFGFPLSLMEALDEYRKLYEEQSLARGMHLDEVGDDWRYALPEPYDYNIAKFLDKYERGGRDITESDYKRMLKILELTKKAKELGILAEVTDGTKNAAEGDTVAVPPEANLLIKMYHSLLRPFDIDGNSKEVYTKMRSSLIENIDNGKSLISMLNAAGYELADPIDIKWTFKQNEYNVMSNRAGFGNDIVFGNFITLIRSNYEWELKLESAVALFNKLDKIYKDVLAEFAGAKIYNDRITAFMDAIMVGRFVPVYDAEKNLFRGFSTKVTENDEDSVSFTNRGFKPIDNMHILYLAFTESFLKIDDAKFASLNTLIKRGYDTDANYTVEARNNVTWFISHIRELLENKEYLSHYDEAMMKENFKKGLVYSAFDYSIPKNSNSRQNVDAVVENIQNFYKKVEDFLKQNKVPDIHTGNTTGTTGSSCEEHKDEVVFGGGWKCTRCGGMNPEKAKFCLECGTEHFIPEPSDSWICSNPSCKAKNIGKFCMQCGTPRPVDSAAFCPNCGKSVQTGAKFCMECGFTLGAPQPTICKGCGNKLEPGAKFCMNCGTKA